MSSHFPSAAWSRPKFYSPAVIRNSATFSWFTGESSTIQRLKKHRKVGYLVPPCWPIITAVVLFFFWQHLADLNNSNNPKSRVYLNVYASSLTHTQQYSVLRMICRSSSLSFCTCTYNTYEKRGESFPEFFRITVYLHYCLGWMPWSTYIGSLSRWVLHLHVLYCTYRLVCMYVQYTGNGKQPRLLICSRRNECGQKRERQGGGCCLRDTYFSGLPLGPWVVCWARLKK